MAAQSGNSKIEVSKTREIKGERKKFEVASAQEWLVSSHSPMIFSQFGVLMSKQNCEILRAP